MLQMTAYKIGKTFDPKIWPSYNIIATMGTPGFPDCWFAPGAQPHLYVPGEKEGGGSVFNAHNAGHPLKRGET